MATWETLLAKKRDFNQNHPSAHSPVEKWKETCFQSIEGESQLIDFRRSFLSGGAINPPDRPFAVVKDQRYADEELFPQIAWFLKLARRFLKLELYSLLRHKCLFKYYPDEQRSKFRKCSLFGNFLMDLPIRVSYYFSQLTDEQNSESKSSVLEIGGGFGALALLYIRQFPLNTYYLIDLPENLLLSYLNLQQSGIPVTTIENMPINFSGVVLLTGDEIAYVKKCDIVVNTMSFQHMNLRNIEFFFSHIFRIQPKKIYLVNRITKRDPTDISILDYPRNASYRLIKENKIFSDEHMEQIWKLIDDYT